MTSSKPNYLPKTPPSDTSTVRIRASACEFGRETHIRSIVIDDVAFQRKSVGSTVCLFANPKVHCEALPWEGTSHILTEVHLSTRCVSWSPSLGICRLVIARPFFPFQVLRWPPWWESPRPDTVCLETLWTWHPERQFAWVSLTAVCRHSIAVPLVHYL